jgi:hypothetical protein
MGRDPGQELLGALVYEIPPQVGEDDDGRQVGLGLILVETGLEHGLPLESGGVSLKLYVNAVCTGEAVGCLQPYERGIRPRRDVDRIPGMNDERGITPSASG